MARSQAWKAHERSVAKELGGVRVGVSGKATADVTTDWCAVECKSRAALPVWLKDAMAQSERLSSGRLPLLVLHELGTRRDTDLVVMRRSEFVAWFGDWRGHASDGEG